MDLSTAFVLITAIVLFCGLVFYALYKKGDVKAGANVGQSSFFIEVKEGKRDGSDRGAAGADKATSSVAS
jgi:hypothetical protein